MMSSLSPCYEENFSSFISAAFVDRFCAKQNEGAPFDLHQFNQAVTILHINL